MRKIVVLSVVLALSWFASPTAAVQQQKIFGVMEDGPHMTQAANAGFDVVKKTVWLSPTNWRLEHLHKGYLAQFDRDMAEAKQQGLRVILELYIVWVFPPPRGPSQRRGVCDVGVDLVNRYPEVIGVEVGVEPNNHDFWKPQFVNGNNVSAASYTQWLAACYDRLKAANPELIVIGGSLASRGEDDYRNPKSNTSPTLFIKKMCETYETSKRDKPLMDWFDMHSYQDEDPATQHPESTTITIADYRKLDKLLECFTAKGHPKPAILWGESGYDTLIPEHQQYRYKGRQPPRTSPLDEATHGRYIAEQIRMAYCQPNSVGFINFLLVDEPKMRGWQSGLFYAQDVKLADGSTPSYQRKQSWNFVREALDAVKNGSYRCG